MKAVLQSRYGSPDVLRIGEVPAPVPGAGEIRIRVAASTVTSGDARIRRADPFLVRLFFGLLRPKFRVPGFEFAGVVESVGPQCSRFAAGDGVFGVAGFGFGALAEYLVMKENGTLARIPEGWSYADAAAIPFGGTTARFFLEDKGGIRAGQRVLIHGASGAVGTAAVQVARLHGAVVDGVCGPDHLSLVESLGAERVFDYTRESPPAGAYDVVFDAAGKMDFAAAKGWLRRGGRVVSVRRGMAKDRGEDYPVLCDWMERGLIRAVIGREFAVEEIVEAHRLVDSGHKTGVVSIRMLAPEAVLG